ncbi:MAG: hypothetical protein WBG68_08090, partial [Poseidonibacter sp.]
MNSFNDIKIRPTILLVIFLLIATTASISLFIQYYSSKDLAYSSTVKLIDETSEKMQENVEKFDEISHDIISLLELSKDIDTYPTISQEADIINKFTTVIKNKNFIYSLYIGYDDDNFYEIINLNLDEKLKRKYDVNKDERWLLVKIFKENNKRIKEDSFLDKDLKVLRKEVTTATYRPTIRPWYIKADKNDFKIIKTSPYLFSNINNHG